MSENYFNYKILRLQIKIEWLEETQVREVKRMLRGDLTAQIFIKSNQVDIELAKAELEQLKDSTHARHPETHSELPLAGGTDLG